MISRDGFILIIFLLKITHELYVPLSLHTININLCIMAEKESYSEEELNEMIVWFNNHADELPKEMQINKAAFTPDLKLTVESCIMQAKQCLGNYKMAGAFRMLQQIRENLEKAVQ